jgi:4-amino-4-deoxy-L-arabinose transferase-like glycosyltransferase
VIFLISTLLLIYFVDPKSYPYEIGGGVDSRLYHFVACDIADGLFSGHLLRILQNSFKEVADYGYSTYLGFFYHFIGKDPILVRFISIIFSSSTVVLVYMLARNIYNEKVARFAGILTMLMPALLWFDTALLKESVMIFLTFLSLYAISEIVMAGRIKLTYLAMAGTAVFLLFFFRLVLAWLIIFSVIFYFLLNFSNRKISRSTVFIAFLILATVLSFMVVESGSLTELNSLLKQGKTQLEDELVSSALQRGLSYNRVLVTPILLVGSIITPFPSIMYFDSGQLVMVSHFFAELVRNCLYFFAFIGILFSYKKRFKESSLILLYTLGYIFVLAASGKSYQDRFMLPSLPGILILISAGLGHGKVYFKHWKLYLVGIGIAILLWNLFKLSLRGLL